MNILVLLKQTFDTEEKVVLQNGRISEDGVQFIINPYDEYAVEEAVKLREEVGGEVTVITVGPQRAEDAIRTALAMGADRGVRIDPEDLECDEWTIAQLLAAAIQTRPFDLVIGGNMAVDSGAGQVALRVAETLGIAHASAVTKLVIEKDTATVERDVEGDVEIAEVPLPLLVTAQQGLNEPRYPSLPGIMKAKKKPLEYLTFDDLGVNKEELAARTVVLDQFYPPQKKAGRILAGDFGQQVSELVQLLRKEAKVI
ncbi:electron transfer flavoprotein subunit beta/FixA family protein [Brevibacillus nitrificans]|uniref:Electron transfer flavoprotein subunit beta n=1 Tax=Brevibacillus nitrificans TaxID=651560 RepID=A0A3M8D7N3_9BACL|nr:electron transfer flavoprotein subunit beta/FixA family protein [Brevibacillus nitrificans]RNB83641.1 electron transfer flavoprotein subunit beta/FixA family protein [Brevibacillus nitrificans]